MEPFILEWIHLILRVAHVVAAIMWIGDSFLFMWLDSHLVTPAQKREGAVVGELWMTHSGGFYEVVKRKSLAPNEMPATLHWFKWESYSTFITGFFLITVVYYLGGRAMLADAGSPLSHGGAVGLSLGLLAGGVALYHALCATPLIQHTRVFGVLGLLMVCGLAYALGHVFTPRAVFLQVGAMLGTIMSSNVFLRIIPAQMHMVGATRAGQPVDTSYGVRAKQRSVHNHYLTLPVLFTMLSNHLPGVYGHKLAYVVLGLVFIFAAGAKYIMNFRGDTHPNVTVGTFGALAAVVIMTAPMSAGAGMETYRAMPTVSFATAQQIVQTRCVTCHAQQPANPAFNAPPAGIMLETPAQMAAHAQRMYLLSVQTQTMPLGNMTGMLDEERTLLGAWVAQGANVNAAGPSQLGAAAPVVTPPAAAAAFASPEDEARSVFSTRCAVCHGAGGAGDGAKLAPPPRNLTDAAWQKTVTDEHLSKVLLEGGAAVGKSGLMPPNPDLGSKPLVLQALVKHIRSLAAP
jgi:uncharacterized membrane protein